MPEGPRGGSAVSPPRRLALLHLLCGAVWLAASRQLRSGAAGDVPARQRRAFASVLGIRHLLEGLLILWRPTRRWVRIGASIDAVHAGSMLLLARVSRAWRKLAFENVALAGGLSLYGLRCSRRMTSERPLQP